VVAVGIWLALVVGSRWWGLRVVRDAPEPLFVDAVPFYGRWDLELRWPLLVAAGVLLAAVVVLPRAADRLGWRALCLVVAAGAVAVGLGLAAVEPAPDTWRNIEGDYGQFTGFVDQKGLGGFLRDYTDDQARYPTHLSAHPPGMVVLLWLEDEIGLGGTAGQVGTAMAGVALGALAVLVAARELAGERVARAAAVFVVVAPAAVWHTNADVVFGGIALSGLAALTLATGRTGRRADAAAVAGGVLLGASVLFSHGLVLMALPAAAILWYRRRRRPGVVAGLAAVLTVAAPMLWGYSWLAGLVATRDVYDVNLARVRPYGYFVVANLAAFAVAVGPATAVALARLRDRATWILVGGGLAAVVAADVSGLSLAETERIWQPFMPLVLVAGAVLASRGVRSTRAWAAVQAVTAIALVAFLRSPW
jgi:hypothetical protein